MSATTTAATAAPVGGAFTAGALDAPAWERELAESTAAMGFAPDRPLLAVATLDGLVSLHDGVTGEPGPALPAHDGEALTLAWSPDGTVLASGGSDGRVHLVRQDAPARVVDVEAAVQRVRWSRDGRALAVAAGRSLVVLTPGGEIVRRWDGQPSTVTDVAWSQDGSRVAAAAYGGLRWYAPVSISQGPVRTFDWRGSLLVVEVAPKGTWVASGNQDASVHLWRLWSGEDAEMTGYPQKVDTLAFDPTGRWMACGGTTDISLWNFAGKGPIGRAPELLDGHEDQVSALAFAHRSSRLASAGRDGGIALWDPPRTTALARTSLPGRVTSLAWSADDHLLAASDVTGRLRVVRP